MGPTKRFQEWHRMRKPRSLYDKSGQAVLNTLKFCNIVRCDVAVIKSTSNECCSNGFGEGHEYGSSRMGATKLRDTMIERASSSHGTPTQLLTDITSDVPIEVRAELGNPETIKQSLRRERAKHLPKNLNSVGYLVLEDEWTKASDGNKYLTYDNGVDWCSCEFYCPVSERDIRRCSITIQSTLCDLFNPRRPFCHLCLLLPDEQKQLTYEEVLSAVRDRCDTRGIQANPTTVSMDFELAYMKAVTSIFGS
ncbi:hypothetical protein LSH36_844g00090 [Paralvinella palmiformis]|uniref:Uncharacterized protein n=1 Tax=Paralvinella palmiformis TaxID=53620 RepID=A0AAD9IYP4_9ANNE|nr:hypothetical protein LSH36_844g00090 [Paralvinella palmiformis]